MVLYPLAVVLLAQIGIILLVIIFYQRLQKKRLTRELEELKQQSPTLDNQQFTEQPATAAFDKEQVALLLNRIYLANQDIEQETPAVKKLCQQQLNLITSLSDYLDIALDGPQTPSQEPQATSPALADADNNEDILSQEELDAALGEGPQELEGFDEELEDLGGLDELEKDDELEGTADELEGLDDLNFETTEDAEPEEYDPLIKSEKAPPPDEDDGELPEDTLQKTLDNLDDFDFSDLEAELLKGEDKK